MCKQTINLGWKVDIMGYCMKWVNRWIIVCDLIIGWCGLMCIEKVVDERVIV